MAHCLDRVMMTEGDVQLCCTRQENASKRTLQAGLLLTVGHNQLDTIAGRDDHRLIDAGLL